MVALEGQTGARSTYGFALMLRHTCPPAAQRRLRRLPRAFCSLSRLGCLELASNEELGAQAELEPGVWEPLCHLTELTALDLSLCCLGLVPRELCALSALRDLDLRKSLRMSKESAAEALAPLWRASALTRLRLDDFGCGLLPGLGALAALRELVMDDSMGLECQGSSGAPLRSLIALTRLRWAPARAGAVCSFNACGWRGSAVRCCLH